MRHHRRWRPRRPWLAERLEDRGENVSLIDKDQEQGEQARPLGFTGHHGDDSDIDALGATGVTIGRFITALELARTVGILNY